MVSEFEVYFRSKKSYSFRGWGHYRSNIAKTEYFFQLAADQSRVMQEQMTMQAGGMPQDPKQAYKAEWEALEITEHNWALRNAEQEMISTLGPTPDNLYHQSISGH